jgi:CheY-like chemotaxis protein
MNALTRPPAMFDDLTVMVVDDHASTRRLVADVLRAGGVNRVVTADGAAQALSLLRSVRPQVLITDWRMPGTDGEALIRTIRQAAVVDDPRIPDPRLSIIMLTGDRARKDVERIRSAGADAYLIKPFTPARVLERVATVFGRSTDFVISEVYVGPDRRLKRDTSYDGPLRRRTDDAGALDLAARAVLCRQILDEVSTFARLKEARGSLDRLLRQMSCRTVHGLRQRSREIGERTLERACGSLGRYVSAVGGAAKADPEVVQTHLDTLRALALLPPHNIKAAETIVRQLEKAVGRRIASQAALFAA